MNKGKDDHYQYVRSYFDAPSLNRSSFSHRIKGIIDQADIYAPACSLLEIVRKNDTACSSLMDVGCGEGLFLDRIIPRFPDCKNFVGIDFATKVLVRAQNNSQTTRLSYLQGDLRSLPCASQSCDVVVCVNVLHHVHRDDLTDAITELARITNKYLLIELRNQKTVYDFWYLPFVIRVFYKDLPLTTIPLQNVDVLLSSLGFEKIAHRGIIPFRWWCRSLVLLYKRT